MLIFESRRGQGNSTPRTARISIGFDYLSRELKVGEHLQKIQRQTVQLFKLLLLKDFKQDHSGESETHTQSPPDKTVESRVAYLSGQFPFQPYRVLFLAPA